MISRRVKRATNNYIENTMTLKDKKWTFSKVIFGIILIMTALVVAFSCVSMWYFQDLTPLEWLIPSVFAECGVITGFYSWKSKEENRIKLQTQEKLIVSALKSKIDDTLEDDFVDTESLELEDFEQFLG